MHTYTKGDKSLIKAILNCAIVDAIAYKNPQPPRRRFSKLQKHMLMQNALWAFSTRNKKKTLSIKNALLMSELFAIKTETKAEKTAWEARTFFNKNNWLFCFYASLVDIDPEYFAEKAQKYFKLVDEGKANVKHTMEDKL